MPKINADDIGLIILAAGSSQRFAGDKRQALLNSGCSLLETTLQQVPTSFKKKCLVLHQGDEQLAQHYSSQWEICFVNNASLGMGHSLATAITTQLACDGVVIGLGDMPLIKPSTYTAIQLALCEHEIVTPMFEGARGNPVGFQKKYFNDLAKLEGDTGARHILRHNQNNCYLCETHDPGILKDIDTRVELNKLGI